MSPLPATRMISNDLTSALINRESRVQVAESSQFVYRFITGIYKRGLVHGRLDNNDLVDYLFFDNEQYLSAPFRDRQVMGYILEQCV